MTQTQKAINSAVGKYKYLQEERVFIEYRESEFILINWHSCMSNYVSMHRVKQIANYLAKRVTLPIYRKGGYKLAN